MGTTRYIRIEEKQPMKEHRQGVVVLSVVLGFLLFVFASVMHGAERVKALYRTHRLSIGELAVSCDDGRAPTVSQIPGHALVIVSCPLGRSQE